MFRLLAILLLLLSPLGAAAEEPLFTVSRVINGKSLLLTNEDTVRLAAIEAPNRQEENTASRRGRPGEPLGEEAKEALERLIGNRPVRLEEVSASSRDRHGRVLAQVYAGETWLQGALLAQGFAMVYSFSDTPPHLITRMLEQERLARTEKRGIWAHPYYRILSPQEADTFINRFKIVQGRVVSVHEVRGNVYLNFFEAWRGRFAVFISRKYAPQFGDLSRLTGKTVAVRGWIHYHNAPMIALTHPGEIESLD